MTAQLCFVPLDIQAAIPPSTPFGSRVTNCMKNKSKNVEQQIEERGQIAPQRESMLSHMPEFAGQRDILHVADRENADSGYYTDSTLADRRAAEERNK